MTPIETSTPTAAQKAGIYKLWNSSYPKRLVYNEPVELDHYLNGLMEQQHIFLVDRQQQICGWCLSFARNNGRWFAIIVNEMLQKKGLGSKLLDHLKEQHTALNGWVIDHDRDKKTDGSPYHSPLAFYVKHGFKTEAGTRLENEKISAVKITWTALPGKLNSRVFNTHPF